MVPWTHWREPRLGRLLTDLTSELTHFNPGIRISRGKQSAFFRVSPVDRCVEQLAAVPGLIFSSECVADSSGKPPFFHRCSRD